MLPNAKLKLIREIVIFCKSQADADRWLEGLHKAGIKE